MNVKTIPFYEIREWFHAQPMTSTLVILFGGDRGSVCDECVVVEVDGVIVSVASIAPKGEEMNGQPAIVGLYTVPAHRGMGCGKIAFASAVLRCVERGLPFPVRVDVLSSSMRALVASFRKNEHDAQMLTQLDIRDLVSEYCDMDRFTV